MDAQFVTPDGCRSSTPRPPSADAGVSSRRIEQFQNQHHRHRDGLLDEIEKDGPEFDAIERNLGGISCRRFADQAWWRWTNGGRRSLSRS